MNDTFVNVLKFDPVIPTFCPIYPDEGLKLVIIGDNTGVKFNEDVAAPCVVFIVIFPVVVF